MVVYFKIRDFVYIIICIGGGEVCWILQYQIKEGWAFWRTGGERNGPLSLLLITLQTPNEAFMAQVVKEAVEPAIMLENYPKCDIECYCKRDYDK